MKKESSVARMSLMLFMSLPHHHDDDSVTLAYSRCHAEETKAGEKNADKNIRNKNKTTNTTMEGPDLTKAIKEQDWKGTARILSEYPQMANNQLSKAGFDNLWADAPLEVIQALLKAWPEAHKSKGHRYKTLIQAKIERGQWDFLKSIINENKDIVTARDVAKACKKDVPIYVFQLMLDQQPNVPLEVPSLKFDLIRDNKLEHFCAVLDRHGAVAELKHHVNYLTPLLFVFHQEKLMQTDWIGPIIGKNPNSAKQKDFDGKTPLHLAYQCGASSEIIDMIRKAYPEAKDIRDNLGRLPKDLANLSEKGTFTSPNETIILANNKASINQSDDSNAKKTSYPVDAVVVCRGDMLSRDLQATQNQEDEFFHDDYAQQVLVRHRIFETLLDEFADMVGVDEKNVIQKAAAIQTLAAQYLSNRNDTIIDFGLFDNPGYWYQQEVLKLVMRVYCEVLSRSIGSYPAILADATVCMQHLERRKNGEASLEPSNIYFRAYDDLTRWLTEGLDSSLHSFPGPVLKPLKSLFNKLFIRRGQTSVSVIGDLVRGTLMVDDVDTLQQIVSEIKTTFPNITESQFRQPDKFDGLVDFLTYVHVDLNFVPNTDVLPYRFKANSSQKKNKDKPLWYNLNFFLQIPEYHRVGFSEMFVVCELQIGLAEEINKHRKIHVAYERDRILSNQPLLKNYDAMTKEEEEGRLSRSRNVTDDDNKLIEKVLFGKIASEVLIPCKTDINSDILLFKGGPFALSNDEIQAGSFEKPERLCLNNRSLNVFVLSGCKPNKYGIIRAAFTIAGPFKLDKTKRYFIDSFACMNFQSTFVATNIGLYAHVGPYMIQIACNMVSSGRNDFVWVKSGHNLSYLEQVCPVPVGATALEAILYGEVKGAREFGYDEIKLSLKVFDVH